ncbi:MULTISPECIES: polysaccharide deacetylase family protein [Cupriavidus]|uniref:polysaccharide deacetylase family protein n=1 Tax=Cupriavidus TaxID=106589 RepID=UPI00035F9D66|nr:MULTISPECIES: polysaccharide deacetylase family protein [Cupriavidus]
MRFFRSCFLAAAMLAGGLCAAAPGTADPPPAAPSIRLATLRAARPLPPIRFLLTFDDGPDAGEDGSTPLILRQLADNPVTPGIKALFFVQTAHPRRGGGEAGKEQMHATCKAGHRLAVHSGLPDGHVSHTRLAPEELEASLLSGEADIIEQCRGAAQLVRPPNWAYDDAVQAVYRKLGLAMLMSDVNARDGKIYGWHISLRRRSHINSELAQVKVALSEQRLAPAGGVVPVVVSFHDTNDYTASHMTEYLQILVEEARDNGLALADPPFYTDGRQAERAARVRALSGVYARESWP